MSEATSSQHFQTEKIRLSYANLFTPKAPESGGDPKFSAAVMIRKGDKTTLARYKAAVEIVKNDPKSLQIWGGKIPPNLKLPLRDGDEKAETNPEYAGHFFFNASSKQKPGLVDQKRVPVTNDTEIYSGCYARVSVSLFAYNTNGNKGIGAGLNNVQKWADGEPFGGRKRAEEEFGEIDDDDALLG